MGAYEILRTNKKIKLTILASGSEVNLALEASHKLAKDKIYSKVISVPCMELFDLQSNRYKNKFTATCSRTIEVNRKGKNIAILEEIQAFKLLKFDIRIHLNPKVKVSLSFDKNKALLILVGQGWDFSFQGNVKLLLEPSIFVEDNGKVKQTNQLILHGETLEERTEILWGFTKN